MFKNAGAYSKFIVSLLGTVTTGLNTWYGGKPWESVLVMALSSVAVYLVPNTPKGNG